MSKTKSGKKFKGGSNGENADSWMPILGVLVIVGLGFGLAFGVKSSGSSAKLQ
jgi:hypothetical protein